MPAMNLPTPPPSPKKNLPPTIKAGQRALDKDEVVAEVGHGGTGRGVTLREERDRFASGPKYGAMVNRMLDEPADVSTRETGQVPLSERFKGPPSARRSTRARGRR